ncbi:MAG TPA: carboxypeptidase regulatory-like domain-containing protein [Actinophytocola sp.]|uniref:carboxypeptidase regulatory-like domain-containing protein n=1 Tax=Actinophytocola sp. TaxID=1872138 RepID=UPI002DBD0BAC|nr:carboxypeptidase regulatory-like domain-containing protein [Actinophytocola sp.]HEU5471704.1 carboxypeptidase regulatory-like domain-containing protein [Actinophytocola sp.]
MMTQHHSAADDAMMAKVLRLVDELDPPPAGLIERSQFAIAIDDIDIEAARWADDRPLAGVRGGAPGTITFFVGDLTVMVNVTRTGERHRIDGWLVPAGEHGVEVRVADHGSTETTADEGGRFVLTEVPRGTTQILVRMKADRPRTVVTPTVVL